MRPFPEGFSVARMNETLDLSNDAYPAILRRQQHREALLFHIRRAHSCRARTRRWIKSFFSVF